MNLITQALATAQSIDPHLVPQAFQTLSTLSKSSPTHYLLNLSSALTLQTNPSETRQLAAILIKNLLKNSNNDPALHKIWLKIDPVSKAEIRSKTLGCLASEDKDVRFVTAQTVASIVCQDLPLGQWGEVLQILIKNASHLNINYRLAAIRTLGYICEEIEIGCIRKEDCDEILTALISGIGVESEFEVRKGALAALWNALRFFSANFFDEFERKVVINVVLDCVRDSCVEIRKSALMVLCEIAELYYYQIENNLYEISQVTCAVLEKDSEQVAVYALEFWNLFIDLEIERQKYNKPSYNYTIKAVDLLIPLILSRIHTFEDDSEAWNIQKGCASTLASISILANDKILQLTGAYITNYAQSDCWKTRASGVLVIGSILEGLKDISCLLQYTLKDILTQAHDPVCQVRLHTAWTISKLCEFHTESLTKFKYFSDVVQCILTLLKDQAEIATHACYSMTQIYSFKGIVAVLNSAKTKFIFERFLEISQRTDIETEFLSAVFTVINKIIEVASDETMGSISKATHLFLNTFEKSVQDDQANLQSLTCFALHTIFAKSKSIDQKLAEKFVNLCLNLFTSKQTVVEEALQALGSLSENLQLGFFDYFIRILPFLKWSIEQHTDSLCKSGLMTLGDFSRSLSNSISDFICPIFPLLLLILSKPEPAIEVKIRTIETLGDLAGNNFDVFFQYLQETMKLVNEAAELSVDLQLVSNPDLSELIKELREAILCFYVEVFQGASQNRRLGIVEMYVERSLEYCLEVVKEEYGHGESVHLAAVGMIGDIFEYFPKKKLGRKKVEEYLHGVERVEGLKEALDYTRKVMRGKF